MAKFVIKSPRRQLQYAKTYKKSSQVNFNALLHCPYNLCLDNAIRHCYVSPGCKLVLNGDSQEYCSSLKGITKFWEILKNGWIVILYNFDIFGCPCGCIKHTNNFSP